MEQLITSLAFYGFWSLLAVALLVYSEGSLARKLEYWLVAHSKSLDYQKKQYRELTSDLHS